MQRRHALGWVGLPHLDQAQRHGLRQRAVPLVARTTDRHLAKPQLHRGGAVGAVRRARGQIDLVPSRQRKGRGGGEQRASAALMAKRRPRSVARAGMARVSR